MYVHTDTPNDTGDGSPFLTAIRSDAGPRDRNEDAAGEQQTIGPDGVPETIVVVADGMGGHAAGDVAANVALRAILSTYRTRQDTDRAMALQKAVETADRAIRSIAASDPAKKSMGATVVTALARPDGVAVAHVGDCRAYQLHDGELEQLTTDHSWVAGLIAAGVMTEEQAEESNMRHVVTRALGRDPLEPPSIERVALAPGDLLMLCSDGLWEVLDEERIMTILHSTTDIQEAADRLVEAASSAGASDNMSVALVAYEPEE